MSTIFTVDDYLAPDWSSEPQHRYYFEIIKDGNLLGKLETRQKPFNLIGRLEDLCDIAIDNPTVSRKHAILQAREADHCLYLYDLGSAHGTFVNLEKLPPHTFKKLIPFDNVKFGVSSRTYIMRCPQYQQFLEAEEEERDNKFAQAIQEQHRTLSKQQLKQKYLDMIENDPYFAANQAPRKLMGRAQAIQDEYEGIDWGISDEREVYAYHNDSDLPIQPDVLRRLNLDSTQLTKLAQYEDHFRRYEEVQNELNELTSREKKEFGLEEKLQDRKSKLQKKFVQALQALEKVEDWLRTNIFGEQVQRDKKNIVKIREKENDTFGDDEYFDRTLENKGETIKQVQSDLTTEDYWRLQKQLKDSVKNLESTREKLAILQHINPALDEGNENKADEQDELEQFMKENNQNLDNQNKEILKREIQILQSQIGLIKNKFKAIMGEQELKKLTTTDQIKTLKDEFTEKSIEENLMETKKKMEQQQSIENILNRLENSQIEEEELNELDPSIFKYYKNADNEQEYDLDDEKLENKRRYDKQYNPTRFEKPVGKHIRLQLAQTKKEGFSENEEVVDLTKAFK